MAGTRAAIVPALGRAITCAMVLACVSHAAAAALTDGLVGHWTFDNPGAPGHDSSPNANHGSLQPPGSGPVWTSDAAVGAGALNFDGADDHVLIPNESDYDLVNAVSYSAWVKTTSGTSWEGVITKHDDMNLQRHSTHDYLTWQTKGTTQYQTNGTSNVYDGEWHHVACTYNGSVKRIYVDNVLEGANPCAGSINNTATQVRIGSNGAVAYKEWLGFIDDVRIYDRAIDATEVRALYELGAGDSTPPAAPTGLAASPASSSQIDLDWDDNAEADLDHYEVHRGAAAGFTPSALTLVATTGPSAYSDTGLLPDTTYHYKVTAVDASVNVSAPSNEDAATTPTEAAPPLEPPMGYIGGGCGAGAAGETASAPVRLALLVAALALAVAGMARRPASRSCLRAALTHRHHSA